MAWVTSLERINKYKFCKFKDFILFLFIFQFFEKPGAARQSTGQALACQS
jgi:hypothetical protein